MALTADRVVIELQAKVDQQMAAIARAQTDFSKRTATMAKSAGLAESRINASFKSVAAQSTALGRVMGSAFASALALAGAQQLIDASTRITNALKVAGLEGDELTKVYTSLFRSAQNNAAPLEALVTLYGRASLVQKELGASTEDMLKFTDRVALALRVSGQSASEASGALLQLSQLLGAGTVRAEEFNSVQEGALPILQAVAGGLKEAGGSVASLRKLVIDGKVSSQAFFKAFEIGSSMLEDKVAGSELTVSQGFVRLQNVMIDTAGKIDVVTGASGQASETLNALAGIIESLGNVVRDFADSDLSHLAGKLYEILNPIGELIDKIGGVKNLPSAISTIQRGMFNAAMGNPVAPPPRQESVNERLRDVLGSAGKSDRATGEAVKKTGDEIADRINQAFASGSKTVSIADYPTDPSNSKNGRTRKTPEEKFDSSLNDVADRTAALVAETEAQRQLNPLVNDYGLAAEKARMNRELLSEAERAGVAITPQLVAEISALSEQYAIATAESAKLAETQDDLRERMEDMRGLGKDVFSGFANDLASGTSAADALRNALGKVLSKIIEISATNIFGASGSNNWFSQIFGAFIGGGNGGSGAIDPWAGLRSSTFASGGYTGAGGKNDPAGVVHKGEVVFSQADIRRLGGVGVVEAMRRGLGGYASGGAVGMPDIGNFSFPGMPAVSPSQGASNGATGVHVTLGWDKDANGNIAPIIKSVSQTEVQKGIKGYDRTGAMRLQRDMQQAATRGFFPAPKPR
ncbi:hypothetical protein C5748_22010 [Phyllobacterium phragmitis]|uniref:Tape measure protein N-terminal domain-containing protein n=1 Tax=Phyllobacterium phragmitis TaxID=2670329 RepID=A0A2S9ILF6_9HYPH|nr:tape measure protein [Phyllobacterium phragmitis]PRD41364.1 hypothetical protein C5748_22010 [Phyllobacterium phragmitis]